MKAKFSRQQAKSSAKLGIDSSLPDNIDKQALKESVTRAKQQSIIQLPTVDKLQQLLTKITAFQDPQTKSRLINKFTIPYLIGLLDKSKLQSIDRVYSMKPQGFNLLEFTRFFLNAIQHSQSETLYLTMGLVDLFKAIAENSNAIQRIRFIHLTDFICLNILCSQQDNGSDNIAGSTSNSYSQNKIDMKLIPQQKVITPNYQIKPYMVNPPKIYGNKEQIVYKLSQTNIKTDKNKHDSVITCCAFSNQYKKIFSLDALAEAIYIYDVNCKLQRKLKPLNLKVKKDVVLLAFTYSHRQERIGAVLKDFTLSFWDFKDNLQFQKVISTASSCQQYQTNIWYLEYFQSWITSDRTGIIYIWNLQTQKPQRRIHCRFKGKINDVCEISCLNILAVAQQFRGGSKSIGTMKEIDQPKIILYNYFKGEEISEIASTNEMRIPHTLQYSQSYQVLLAVGFQKKINIFEINHKYLDTSLKGELHGHENLITHFTLVKKTPMVVSCDDKGKVKIWDLRSYKCVQTLDFRDKTLITRLLDMVDIGKFGVLGSRVNFLQYDQKQQIIKRYQLHERNIPLNIDFIYQSNKLLITTKKDLRIYDMQTGRVEKVYCEFHKKDEEIVIFKYYEFMKKLLITNEKGEIQLVSIKGGLMQGSGESEEDGEGRVRDQQRLEGFSNGTVTHVQYDQQNKLFLTCGGNGTIKIHKLLITLNPNNDPLLALQPSKQSTRNKKQPLPKQPPSKHSHQSYIKPYKTQQWTVIRQMRGNFYNKDMTAMAFSVYHGMIAIGSSCSDVYVWDYQYARLLFGVTLPKGMEPTALSFINGFSILVIAASNGEVYFVKLLRQNQQQYQDKSHTRKTLGPQHLLSFKDNRQLAFNPLTNTMELAEQQDQTDCITQIIVDISLKGTHNNSQSIQFAKIYMAYNSGKIAIIELSQMLRKHFILPHRKTLSTYNPQRQLKQNFSVQLEKNKILTIATKPLQESHVSKRSFPYPYSFMRPHSGAITEMKILQFDCHYLVTCGNERIKVWGDLQGSTSTKSIISSMQLLGDFNINHPLPYLWSFTVNNDRKIRDKIMFSLKIIQSIFKKFGSDISTGQSKLLRLEKFFKSLSPHSGQKKVRQKFRDSLSYKMQEGFKYLTQPDSMKQQQSESQKGTIQIINNTKHQPQHPYLFQQQYSKKDMHYDEIKKYNFYQIGGPSLRQLQFRKKMDTMQKQWQAARLKQEQEKSEMMNKILLKAQKNEEKQQIISFLQDRRFSTKRQTSHGRGNSGNSIITAANYNSSFANITNSIVNAVSSNANKSTTLTNNNNNNTNNNIPTVTTISPIDQEQSQLPVVKRIAEELQRVEAYQQQQQHMKEVMNSSVGGTGGMFKSYSQQFMGKYGNNTSPAIMMKSSPMQVSILDNSNQEKTDYGCMLRKYYHSSTKTSFHPNPKSSNPKGFEEYYLKKQPQKSHLQTGQQQQFVEGNARNNQQLQRRMQKISSSSSKHNSAFRSISQQSLRSRNINKVKSQQHISFQTILKDMNSRVLLSRQGRTVKQSNQGVDSQKVFENPIQKDKRSRRLMKTAHYGYSRENKIN